MVSVAVIGAGVSGLTAAYRLRVALGPDAGITVYERLSAPGGKLRTVELAGRPCDVGAEAFLVRRPEAVDLAVGLGLDVVHPRGLGATVYAGGRVRPLPTRTLMGVPASGRDVVGVLSPAGVAGVDTESPRLDWDPRGDISVGALVRSRLGDEVVDRLVDPLLGGVYAVRADELGLRATIPALAAALDRGAPTLTAAVSALLPPADGTGRPATPVFGTVAGGMGGLITALAGRSGARIVTGVTVRGLARTADGWRLDVDGRRHDGGSRTPVDHDAVVLAVPAPAARDLLRDVCPTASAVFAEVGVASMAVIALALPDGTRLPDASGVLIAGDRRHATGSFTAKALTYSCRKWTHHEGVVLRASVGRHGDVSTLRRDDDELIRLVRRDLAELTGVTAEPIDTAVCRWGGGLPRYAVGHTAAIARMRAAVAALPGLAVAGAAVNGVGVPACVATATEAARQVVADLTTRRSAPHDHDPPAGWS